MCHRNVAFELCLTNQNFLNFKASSVTVSESCYGKMTPTSFPYPESKCTERSKQREGGKKIIKITQVKGFERSVMRGFQESR